MITHDESENQSSTRGTFAFTQDDKVLAKMTYSRTSPTLVIIDHTEVSDALKGQGIGRKLLDALVAWARETGTKVMATCPYALAQFRKDATIRDVFVG